jgi:hypothetical protein
VVCSFGGVAPPLAKISINEDIVDLVLLVIKQEREIVRVLRRDRKRVGFGKAARNRRFPSQDFPSCEGMAAPGV